MGTPRKLDNRRTFIDRPGEHVLMLNVQDPLVWQDIMTATHGRRRV